MRIFVAGASGVLGSHLVPLLVAAGHSVAGMTRTPSKADSLRAVGAEPVVCDVFDADALTEAVVSFRPDTVLHELTDLPDDRQLLPQAAEANSRIRREGTRNLLDAARAASAGRFLAQSVAWTLPGDGGAAVADLESAVLAAGGVVLRYGQFYGDGTFYPHTPPAPPRVHVADAARRTVAALHAPSGVITIVDETDPT
ncbi:NAD(P)-dependent oxidoreductase [Planosporangium thailandense]|uniref:NAD(P)-dependent oxidoreductase n=1 Tax=Planosporangium thailandense TaxID=765197 RepID=A0ABX0Y5E4_9ACTN|nr:NAD(P)-dependent oxidoreductase [Planosporangium thailandense]NJC73637.1 NAD(P)-dependent oxidoreductase [Planosporangium thailandense]